MRRRRDAPFFSAASFLCGVLSSGCAVGMNRSPQPRMSPIWGVGHGLWCCGHSWRANSHIVVLVGQLHCVMMCSIDSVSPGHSWHIARCSNVGTCVQNSPMRSAILPHPFRERMISIVWRIWIRPVGIAWLFCVRALSLCFWKSTLNIAINNDLPSIAAPTPSVLPSATSCSYGAALPSMQPPATSC